MNATQEIDRLLNDYGAILVRHKKHLVYRLPNGNTFTRSKTQYDGKVHHLELTSLRHALGIAREKPTGEIAMQLRPTTPAVIAAPPPAAPAPETKEFLKQRIEAAISAEEAVQEKLLAEAQAHERKVHMLKALLPFADDPATEESLRGVLPAIRPPEPVPQPPPDPPQRITERVQVTRQLVLAATQTFEEDFTINGVLSCMTGGAQIDGVERQRVRSSIASAMIALLERGELLRVSAGIGKRQSVWRKVPLNGRGNGTRA